MFRVKINISSQDYTTVTTGQVTKWISLPVRLQEYPVQRFVDTEIFLKKNAEVEGLIFILHKQYEPAQGFSLLNGSVLFPLLLVRWFGCGFL